MPVHPSEIYANQLRVVGQGYALFEADPLGPYDQIILGNAGYIANGKFIPGWRMWEPEVSPTAMDRHVPNKDQFHSQTMKRMSFQESVAVGEGVMAGQAKIAFGYTCHSTQGALLALKDPHAWSRDLKPVDERQLRKRIARDYVHILEECGLTTLDELRVVTGTTMTGDWEAAVFSANARGGNLDAGAGIPTLALAKTAITISYSSGHSPARSGGHQHLPPRTVSPCCPKPKNQCVFIRHLRVRKRLMIAPKIIKGAAEPKDDSPDERDACDDVVVISDQSYEEDGTGDRDTERELDMETYEQIFHHIFSNSNAELAFIHDRDVWRWIEYDPIVQQEFVIEVDPQFKTGWLASGFLESIDPYVPSLDDFTQSSVISPLCDLCLIFATVEALDDISFSRAMTRLSDYNQSNTLSRNVDITSEKGVELQNAMLRRRAAMASTAMDTEDTLDDTNVPGVAIYDPDKEGKEKR